MSEEKKVQHIAFIMDGNRRWAKAHALELLQGHTRGADNIRPLVEHAVKCGIPYITFWAFSTENWKRDEREVGHLMNLFREFLKGEFVADLMTNEVCLKVIGDISRFPQDLQEGLSKVMDESKDNRKITVVMALNYGGREEIMQAVNKVIESKGGNNQRVTPEEFESCLYTSEIPDPDIIVRTGGDVRLSGFMPWQSVYSELFFVDTLWPDFTPEHFQNILDEYSGRTRRFGK